MFCMDGRVEQILEYTICAWQQLFLNIEHAQHIVLYIKHPVENVFLLYFCAESVLNVHCELSEPKMTRYLLKKKKKL